MHGENLINFKVTLEGQTYTGLAPDAVEAATKFIEKVNPSKIPCLIDVEDNDNSENKYLVFAPLVLSNMGKHKQKVPENVTDWKCENARFTQQSSVMIIMLRRRGR